MMNEAARTETDLSPRTFELLSTASALVQTVPRDLEARYGKANKQGQTVHELSKRQKEGESERAKLKKEKVVISGIKGKILI